MAFFHQSPDWERFQRALGRTTQRVDGWLLIEGKTPLGRYWYSPRPRATAQTLAAFVGFAQRDRAAFVRVDPAAPVPTDQFSVRPTLHTQPRDSLILAGLDRPEEALLAGFHEKTRYNIRLAKKRGVVVEESADISAFLELSRGTADRQAFRYHEGKYYRTMLETLQEGEVRASLLIAKAEGRVVAANVLLWTPDTAYYLHGASSYADRKLMAPHLLQWEGIRRAKAAGLKRYDFWGIAPLTADRTLVNPNHTWAGITRFKLGFGGEVVRYPDSFDVVLQPAAYALYTMGRRLRRSLPL